MSTPETAEIIAAPAARATGRRPRLRGSLLLSELALLFRRRRTQAMLLALAAVPILIAVAVRLSGSDDGPVFVNSISGNGLFTGLAAVTVAIPLFLPLTVGVVSGDTIAGEASGGTLRYLLVAPAGRLRLLAVKFAAALVFCLAAAATIMLTGLLIGLALFPIGPVTLLSGSTVPVGEAVLRAAAIALYVAVALAGLASIGLFISTLTDVPVGAMAATVVVAVAAQIVGALPQLDWLHPWLFSDRWLDFVDLIRDPISWSAFGENALLQLAYVAVFGTLAAARFTTRDVLA